MTAGPAGRLHLRVAEDQRDSWVVPLLAEVAAGRGWTLDEQDEHGAARSDALALVRSVGDAVPPLAEPSFVVAVEAGTPRSPIVVESAAHLLARFDLVLGEFKARRNQEVTRAAIDRFLARVEDGPSRDARTTDESQVATAIAESRTLLAAVDVWLASSTMTPDTAQAIHADRAILEAAIGAPVVDLVIVERAATRLTLRIAR